MQYPLSPTHFIERAGRWFGGRAVVSEGDEGTHRGSWAEVLDGARRVSALVASWHPTPGDRVATLGWNTHRHLELYFGVPAAGAVLHTVNVRLAPAQIARILEHAGTRTVLADPEFTDLVDRVEREVSRPLRKIVLDGGSPSSDAWPSYDELVDSVAPVDPLPVWPEESAAGLCYTSGTTGEPKGVMYSHRAMALHAMAISLPDGFGLGENDTVLPAVPMFHANAWGLPHAAAMTGAGLVLPGPRPSVERIAHLLSREGVTFAAGVPTVWMGVLEELRRSRLPLSPRLRIHSGGAPTPSSLVDAYREEFGVEIVTGWGMTELTPVGMAAHPRHDMSAWTPAELAGIRTAQGTPLPFVEARAVDETGTEVDRDGRSVGELEVRGPWVAASYYQGGSPPESFRDGWLRTGDVATVDGRGYVRLVDRTKDLIRSGGEWISSVQLENALMDDPRVSEAAVVAVPHPRWQERPLACVVLKEGVGELDGSTLFAPLEGRFPRWWIPEDVVFMAALPRTSTGKFDKKTLREWVRRERGDGSDGS